MKIKYCILFALTTSLFASEDSYTNRIIQIIENPVDPLNPIVEFLDHLDAEGKSVAPREVPNIAVFQLHTTHVDTFESYLLDEKTVSTYHPQAEVSIVSEDPYEAIPRTRVDRPFTVRFNLSGIVTDNPDAQEAAKSVVLDHRVVAYSAGATEAAAGAPRIIKEHDPIRKNGDSSLINLTTQLSAPDLTKIRGEEQFSVFANPDFGDEGGSLLAQARIQIWPIASGVISGIDSTRRYATIPAFNISTVDLYPESHTFIRYYKSNDPTNTNLSGVIGNYTPNTVVPVSNDWQVRELDKRITEDGVYTLELLHETIFNTIRLGAPVQIIIDRTIVVKGGVISAE